MCKATGSGEAYKSMSKVKLFFVFVFLSIPNLSGAEDVGWKKGDYLPDIAYKQDDGELTSLHKQRGKAVFVNFWATWCPPCVKEWPIIQKAYNDLDNNERVEFLLFNIYESFAEGVDWVNQHGYSVPISNVMYVERNTKKKSEMALTSVTGEHINYEQEYIPTSFILNPDGKIIKIYYAKGLTSRSLKKAIAKALEQ